MSPSPQAAGAASADRGAEPGFLKASLRVFLFAFPISCAARVAGKWASASSGGAFVGWLRSEWVSELAFCLILSALLAMGLAHQARKDRQKEDDKRNDRYVP